MSEQRPNPFVGPRPIAYGETLYGRERELAQLRDLLISEQVVLLYSPSGAGKTSLIDAGLRPVLEDARFTVPPIARVGKLPPRASSGEAGPNRYVYSMLTYLEEGSSSQLSPDELSKLTLPEYLTQRAEATKGDYVLVLDQFEEFFTVDPIDRAAKEDCFAQLGAALEDRGHRLWLLLAMREEYLAGLDPFCQSIPGYLNVRFRLGLLTAEEARQAIARSAADGGIPFVDQAVDTLVDDLRRVLIQEPDGALTEKEGEYVEPVHLQVVCRRLWRHLPEQATEISVADVHTQGNVDDALTAYYDECVSGAGQEGEIGERAVRNWLDEKLITPQGMRGQVLRSIDRSEGMDNRVLDRLVDDHLIRAERRRGLSWYELAHDRLVEPVHNSNRRWRETHLQLWQRTAEEWAKAGRPSTNLLTGGVLQFARDWAKEHPEAITVSDREFLEASAREQRAREAQVKQRRAIRGLSAVLAVSVLAVGAYYYWSWVQIRPWGFLVNLSDGYAHHLKGDYILVGRATVQFTPPISLIPPMISRTHLLIDRKRRVIDVRTMNGTTRNGGFLSYGDVQELADGDVLVLGNIAPFKFHSINYSWWQLWGAPKPEASIIPQRSWGLLIDGASKAVHYLVHDSYYVDLGEQDEVAVSETRTAQSRVILRRQARPGGGPDAFAIEDLDDGHELFATFKLGETYAYGACLIPPARIFVVISFKALDEEHLCEHINWRKDYDEKIRYEQLVENLIFSLSEKSSFRVIPRIVGLEKRQRE